MRRTPFPGNVRELRSLVHDAASRQSAPILRPADFKTGVLREDPLEPGDPVPSPLVFSDRLPSLDQASDLLVAEAMKRANGNQSLAAGMLGISHQAISRRLQKKKRPDG